MDFRFSFMYWQKLRVAHAFIDDREEPYFIFTILLDGELIREFSEEVTIKTDFNKVLPKEDDTIQGIVELRQVMFNAIKETEEFRQLKIRVSNLDNKQSI